ncbi:MAG: ATP-binding cassette domain-containing protein [Betaproteobacteria bacterium]|nr:ATP-binding cassette domain-containing protein [Betaproteobacteria bacterium]
MSDPSKDIAPTQSLALFRAAIFKRRRVFTEAGLGTFVLNLIGLGTAMYSMTVYDRVIPNSGFDTLWVLTIGVMGAIVLELVMKQVRARMVDRACKYIDMELSDHFFGRALAIRMDARPRSIGTFAAQIRMYESVRTFLTSTTLFVLADIPFAFMFVGVIAMIAGPVALVPLILIPVSVGTGLMFTKPFERMSATNVAESNYKNGLLIESIDGIETIKAQAAERTFRHRWHALTLKLADNELDMKSMSGLSTNLTQLIQQVSYVGMIATGVFGIVSGNLTMGGLIACSIISGRALGPFSQIASLLVQWQHSKSALKGLEAIMRSPIDGETEPGQRPIEPESCACHLRLEQVHFAYEPNQDALEVPSLQFKPGDRVAVIGNIGSGKSTLLKILAGLYKPTTGRAFLDGVDMSHLSPDFVRRHISYLPQDARLFNGTLRDNLILGLPQDPGDEVILDAARKTGLDKVISAHPRGLNLFISEGGMGLSGGQRQLVTLTRLLLSCGNIVLLDEPTSSLDGPVEEQCIQALMGSVNPQGVLFMVTHKNLLMRHVNRVVLMDRGKVVLDGPRDAVLAKLMQKPAPVTAQEAVAPGAPAA